jgi:hypothetical protein
MKNRLMRMLQNVVLVSMLASAMASFAQYPLEAMAYCSGLTCDTAEDCGTECFCSRGTCRNIMDEGSQ